ncbi:MAG TPA: type VI secretion system protein TssA [Polyangia bacterium]|jgi:type VI secretion system protein ImpA
MTSSELETFLAPVSAEAPCGVDLEAGDRYDPAFTELERISQGKAEQQIGSTIVAAEEPDWKAVRRKATEILARSKDLRVACHLANAMLRTDGWSGFAVGLAVLRGFVERYWEQLYPALDPDDGDPQVRITSFMSVSGDQTVTALRSMALIASRTLGRFSVKDLEIASGDAQPDKNMTTPPTTASIDAVVMNCDLPALEETTNALRDCVEMLAGLEAAIAVHVETSRTPSFNKLAALLKKGHGFLAAKLAVRSPAAAVASEGGGEVTEQTRPAGLSFSGGISSRDDVLKALDGIAAYYAKYEPANPIPIFMARCKRLVMMDFIDIVRELVPDALTQVEALQGQVK